MHIAATGAPCSISLACIFCCAGCVIYKGMRLGDRMVADIEEDFLQDLMVDRLEYSDLQIENNNHCYA
jgi:hypothetical protein